MGLFDGLFGGGGPNPMDEANQYLGQIPDVLKQYLNPAFQRGERAAGSLEGQYGKMTGDPSAFINELMKQYQPSEGYKYQQQQASRAAANTAAAGGMRGTPYEQAEQQRITQGLMGKDMQQWLQNVLGVQGRGLAGQESLYGKGLGAGTNLAESLANALGTQGTMAYQDALQQQKDQDAMARAFLNLAGGGFNWATGGA